MEAISQELNYEQRTVAKAILDGDNVFCTGKPGTGKSHLVARVVELLRNQFPEGSVGVCAYTGIASLHIGGTTLHSFLGVGLNAEHQKLWRPRSEQVRQRLRNVRAIVIDEVSMLPPVFLERMEELLRWEREDEDAPFGGVQIIMCGDFLQLPPVKATEWAFEADAWATLNPKCFTLTTNHRQAEDAEFKAVLDQVRNGVFSPRLLAHAQACEGQDAGEAVRIVCTNREASDENIRRLKALPGKSKTYLAEDDASDRDHPFVKNAFSSLLVEPKLVLKKGASVMLLKNLRLPENCIPGQIPLVNGTQGVVKKFEDGYPVVEFKAGKRSYLKRFEEADFRRELYEKEVTEDGVERQRVVAWYSRLQLPLRLSWAMTVHKSQGLTLSAGFVDLTRAFDPAQAYVALSRFRRLGDIHGLQLCEKPVRRPNMRARAERFHLQLDKEAAERETSRAGAAEASFTPVAAGETLESSVVSC